MTTLIFLVSCREQKNDSINIYNKREREKAEDIDT